MRNKAEGRSQAPSETKRLARSGDSRRLHATARQQEQRQQMVGLGDGREGGKSVPGGGGRCHCVSGVNSYGTQILTTEEGWGKIQV